MSLANGVSTDIARLQTRVDQHDDRLNFINKEIKELRKNQVDTNIILTKLNTTLENTNETLKEHKELDEQARKELTQVMTGHIKLDTRFKIVTGILAAIGLSVIGLVTKIMFFFPSSGGGND